MPRNLTHFKSIIEASLQSVQEAKQQQEIALAIDRELKSDYFHCITSPFLSAKGKANKDIRGERWRWLSSNSSRSHLSDNFHSNIFPQLCVDQTAPSGHFRKVVAISGTSILIFIILNENRKYSRFNNVSMSRKLIISLFSRTK